MHPKHAVEVDYTHTAEAIYKRHDDRVRIFLRISDYIVKDASFKASGCPRVIAASEALCRLLINVDVETAMNLNEEHIREEMDFHDKNFECVRTPLIALKKALSEFAER